MKKLSILLLVLLAAGLISGLLLNRGVEAQSLTPKPAPTPLQIQKKIPNSTADLIERVSRRMAATPTPTPAPTPKPKLKREAKRHHAPMPAQITVASGDNLQTKINAASCGDFLNLEAGATFDGSFTINQNCSAAPLTIRSANYALLPNGRIGSTSTVASDTNPHSANMARVRTLGGGTYGAAIVLGANAGGIVLDGLEITDNSASTIVVNTLIDAGLTNAGAHDLIVQRCWIHQKETGTNYNRSAMRGVWFEGVNLTMKWNYIFLIGYYYSVISGEDFYQMDTTAMLSVAGPGPITLFDNFISVWWNGIFQGGADTNPINTATVTGGSTTSGVFNSTTGLTPGLVLRLDMNGSGTLDGSDFLCAAPNPNLYHCTHYTEVSGFTLNSGDDQGGGNRGGFAIVFSGPNSYRGNVWKYLGGGVSEVTQNGINAAGTYNATLMQTAKVTSVAGSTVNYTPYGVDAITTGKVPTAAAWNYGDQGLINDTTVQRNTFAPHLLFAQSVQTHKGYSPKGLIEIKNCNRFDFNANRVVAYPANIAFTATSQYGTAPWSATRHIKIRNNWISPDPSITSALNIIVSENSYGNTVTSTHDVAISNNLMKDVRSIGGIFKGGDLWLFAHNTSINSHGTAGGYNSMLQGNADFETSTNWTFRDNIAVYVLYGAQCFVPPAGLADCWPGGVWQNNVIMDLNSVGFLDTVWGSGGILSPIPTTIAGVGFTNEGAEIYSLAPSSNYKNDATDGTDPGVNWQALMDALGSSVNVALAANGGSAVASSTYSTDFPAASVINGERSGTGWGAGSGGWNDGTSATFPDSVEITFSGAKSINEIDVFTLQDNYTSRSPPTETMTFTQYGITAFDVQYWDGSQWVLVPGGQITGNNLVWRKLSFGAITTTKIRVMINNALANHSRITEIEAYTAGAPPPPSVNVALAANGGSAVASSTYNTNFPAASVINGERSGTGWGSAGGGWNDGTSATFPDSVEITFSGAKSVNEVDVFTLQDNYTSPSTPTETMTFTQYGITAFDVQYWDGSQWVLVPGGQVTGNNLVWRKLSFGAITTTKIRVVVNNALAGYSRITEIEAYAQD